jgi:hypothetical protein
LHSATIVLVKDAIPITTGNEQLAIALLTLGMAIAGAVIIPFVILASYETYEESKKAKGGNHGKI